MTDACNDSINLKAPRHLVESLRELAARESNPMSATIRRLLTAGVEHERRVKLQAAGDHA